MYLGYQFYKNEPHLNEAQGIILLMLLEAPKESGGVVSPKILAKAIKKAIPESDEYILMDSVRDLEKESIILYARGTTNGYRLNFARNEADLVKI